MRPWLAGLLATAVAAPARADDTDLRGLPVSQVRIVAPVGGAPDESLDPLLRSRQGEPLDLSLVRVDVTTLFRVGEFASVDAEIEPWSELDADGEPVNTVLLTYVVRPAPRVARVRVQGQDALPARVILDAARLSTGETFYEELDAPVVAYRIRDALQTRGYPDAVVEVDPIDLGEGRLEVWLRVDEGPPRTVASVGVVGDHPVPDERLLRWAKRAGVQAGEPVSDDTLRDAQYAIRDRLAAMPTLLSPTGGWVESRVQLVTAQEGDELAVTVFVEAGRRLDLDVSGLGWWRTHARVEEALGIDARTRLTRGFLDQAPDNMVGYLQRRGYLDATADVALVDQGDTRVLTVDVERGPRTTLTHIGFEGARTLDPVQLATVMKQASSDVLRRRRVTPDAVEVGLDAAENLYAAHGHLDADLTLRDQISGVRHGGPLGLPNLWDAARAATGVQLVRLVVDVDEGPVTLLADVELRGAVPELVDDALQDELDAMVGAPLSRPALHGMAQRLTALHRNDGYLEADARVVETRATDGSVNALLTVRPGPRVLLRSVTTRGARRTRAAFLRRALDLDLGQPVTPTALEDVRRSLYALQSFRSVSTQLLGDDVARDLVVEVEERPLWGFETGFGFSTDQGVRTFGRATRRNLWGTAHRMETYLLVGALWNGDELTDWIPDLSDPEWRATISYIAPMFPARRQQLVLDLILREEKQERSWRLARSGFGVALESQLGRRTTLRTETRLEQRRLQELDLGALIPGEPWDALIDPSAVELPTPWRLSDALSAVIVHDLRDDPLQPTRGVLMSAFGAFHLGVPQPTLPDAATASFAKGEARVSGYIPTGPATVRLTAEVGAGYGVADAIVPLEERYRNGGTGSVRGFKRDAVGPRNEVAQPDVAWPEALGPIVDATVAGKPTRWVPTGGDLSATGTVELLVPLSAVGLPRYDGYSAALFTDVGNAWLMDPLASATTDEPDVTAIYNPVVRYGVGAGLRIATPVGPLQVDVAANLDSLFAAGPRRVLLRDDWEDPPARAHLSLGTLW